VVPEILLLYKAGATPASGLDWLRRRDKLDLLTLLPNLSAQQRDWLRDGIALVGHPWLALLSQGAEPT
jgi:hypothetical protein